MEGNLIAFSHTRQQTKIMKAVRIFFCPMILEGGSIIYHYILPILSAFWPVSRNYYPTRQDGLSHLEATRTFFFIFFLLMVGVPWTNPVASALHLVVTVPVVYVILSRVPVESTVFYPFLQTSDWEYTGFCQSIMVGEGGRYVFTPTLGGKRKKQRQHVKKHRTVWSIL